MTKSVLLLGATVGCNAAAALLLSRAEQPTRVGGRRGAGRALAVVPLHGLEPAETGERVALETGLVHLGPALHRVEPVETACERVAVEPVGVHLGPALGRCRSRGVLIRLAQSDAATAADGVRVQAPQHVCHGRWRSGHRPAGQTVVARRIIMIIVYTEKVYSVAQIGGGRLSQLKVPSKINNIL